MKSYDIIGYGYDAALHCVNCTMLRFGKPDPTGNSPEYGIPEDAQDSEGNPVQPYFVDEACDGHEDEVCDDCGEKLLWD